MARCTATRQNNAARGRNRATPPSPTLPASGEGVGGDGDSATEGAEGGLYETALDPADRAALESALAAGLDAETALMRVLIRRALVEGRPAAQVAYLVSVLAQIVKTQHVLAGKSAKQLDEALAAALDAIAAEMGVKL